MSEFIWTKENVQMLLHCVQVEGKDYTTCARRIGTTKPSVCGKMRRMRRAKESPGTSIKPVRQAAVMISDREPNPEVLEAINSLSRADEVVDFSKLKSVSDVGNGDCRYPHGDPRTKRFGFCGQQTTPGSSYCEHHHGIVFMGRKMPKVAPRFEVAAKPVTGSSEVERVEA